MIKLGVDFKINFQCYFLKYGTDLWGNGEALSGISSGISSLSPKLHFISVTLDEMEPSSKTQSLAKCVSQGVFFKSIFTCLTLLCLRSRVSPTMDLSHCSTVYITFCIRFFLHNHTLHLRWALLQSTDQLQASLPSDQDYNNTLSPSCSAAVNYLGCRTSLIFPSLNPWGIFINAQALHQI